jgi:hypothetical protein
MDFLPRGVATLILLALLASCSSSETVAPVSTGRISGFIRLADSNCAVAHSSAGITIQIVGSSRTATTDDTGHWEFYDVPAGYYSFYFGKLGYTHQIFSDIAFLGTGVLNVPYKFSLAPIPTAAAFIDEPASITKSSYISGDSLWSIVPSTPKIGDDPSFTSFNWFVGKTPHIDYQDSTSYVLFAANVSSGGSFVLYPPAFRAGDTLYVAAYQSTCNAPIYNYHDGDILRSGFTGFGPVSNSVRIILP